MLICWLATWCQWDQQQLSLCFLVFLCCCCWNGCWNGIPHHRLLRSLGWCSHRLALPLWWVGLLCRKPCLVVNLASIVVALVAIFQSVGWVVSSLSMEPQVLYLLYWWLPRRWHPWYLEYPKNILIIAVVGVVVAPIPVSSTTWSLLLSIHRLLLQVVHHCMCLHLHH